MFWGLCWMLETNWKPGQKRSDRHREECDGRAKVARFRDKHWSEIKTDGEISQTRRTNVK